MKQLNENLVDVVKILSEGEFHDGTAIGEALGITRAAVWKMIKKLEAYGISIESVKGKGYALQEKLTLLDIKKIKSLLRYKKLPIEVFEEIGSTSDYLKSFISENHVRVCVSECQRSGRGRFNRQWHSPFGQNLYLSLLYPFEQDLSEIRGLSIAIGILIAEAIEKSFQLPETLALKWPNDIFCKGAKLAGSLIEIQAESNGSCCMILGVGINVNMLMDSEKQIADKWTSIKKINQLDNDRNVLCANLINHLLDNLQRYNTSKFSEYLEKWHERDFLLNKIIKLKAPAKTAQGKMLGLDEFGNLQLKLRNGELQVFSAGDTTLLKNN
jgi:BirA family biotin operon repressor/biotin-[acetyl-CoA-carboxylase] ligase